MILKDTDVSCCTDLETWFSDFDISETLMRYWYKPTSANLHPDEECSYGYFEQFIDLGNNTWLVGIRNYDERYSDHKYPMIEYVSFDEITFAFCEEDSEDKEDNYLKKSKYRKRSVEVEAVRYKIDDTLPDWFMDKVTLGEITLHEDGTCDIKTLEGIMHANYGDYIIKGVVGEIYPCKPDIFEKTYEKVD